MTLFYSWGSLSLVFWLPLSPWGWLPCCRGPHTSGEAVFGIPLGPYIPCSRVTFLLSMRKCFSLIHSSSQSGFHSSTDQILRVSCNHFIFSPDATGLLRSCLDITVMALKPASRSSPLQTSGWVTESILPDLDSEKWNISCQMGKQSTSHSLQPLTEGELEGPEDTQGRKNTYRTAVQDRSHSPPGARRRLRMWKHRVLPHTVEVHIKGMISVSPDSCIFPYIENTKFLHLSYLVSLISSNLLMFPPTCPLLQDSYIP